MACLLAACGRFGFASHGDASASGDANRDANGDAPPDAPPDTGDAASVCTATFCDSFDTGISSAWMSDTYAGSTAPALAPAPVHSGLHSVALVTNAISSSTTNARALLDLYAPLPFASTIVYARAWFYVQSPFDTNATFVQFINFADASGNGISIGSRHNVLTANDYTGGGYAESATSLPLDTWFCLRMEMPSGSTATVRTYLGPMELTDIALPKSSAQPAPDHVYIGFEWVGTITSQSQASVWLDDVAIGTSPIPCN